MVIYYCSNTNTNNTTSKERYTSMKILSKSNENLTPAQIYNLCKSPTIKKMKDAVDSTIEIDSWLHYIDVNSKDEEQEILSIATPENEVFATNSPTFIREFIDMLDMMSDMDTEVHTIRVLTGKSKSDRDYITCQYIN